MILDFFPHTAKIQQPRPTQLKILPKIEEKIKSGCKKIIVVMPAGGGKSSLALCAMNWFTEQNQSHGLYTSPLNSLVNQVHDDFYEIGVRTLKGRSNYPCIAKCYKSNCDEGYCQSEICQHHTKEERKCKEQPYEECNVCKCNSCLYKQIKEQFINSKISNTNFTLYSIGITNKPDVVIVDESDTIEDTIRNDKSVTIKESWGKQTWPDYLILLQEYARELELESIDENGHTKPKIKRKIEVINDLLNDYNTHKEEWNVRTSPDSIMFEPVTVQRFIDPLFKDKTIIMMSATPERLPGWDVLEVGSELPEWSVPWQYKPLGKMTLDDGIYEGSHRENTIPKICSFILELEGKTLVHCNSYAVAIKMSECLLKDHGVYALTQKRDNFITIDSYDLTTSPRYEIISAFKSSKDKNKIALTVNMGRGIDCPEPEICNSVIACMPQFNPSDSLTKAKNRLIGKSWMDRSKANDIMQADSRIKRGIIKYKSIIAERPDLDWLPHVDGLVIKKSWILDSNFNSYKWFSENRNRFYNWFLNREKKN